MSLLTCQSDAWGGVAYQWCCLSGIGADRERGVDSLATLVMGGMKGGESAGTGMSTGADAGAGAGVLAVCVGRGMEWKLLPLW